VGILVSQNEKEYWPLSDEKSGLALGNALTVVGSPAHAAGYDFGNGSPPAGAYQPAASNYYKFLNDDMLNYFSAWTIEMMLYITSASASYSGDCRILGFMSVSAGDFLIDVRWGGVDTVYFVVNCPQPTSAGRVTASVTWPANTWFHLAFVFDINHSSQICRVYKDGLQCFGVYSGSGYTADPTAVSDISIGLLGQSNNQALPGRIDNIKIYPFVKTDFSQRGIERATNWERGAMIPGLGRGGFIGQPGGRGMQL
jgi:hypothetical protein